MIVISAGALLFGAYGLLTFVRFGYVSPIEGLMTFSASAVALTGVWSFRWWGLMVASAVAAYVILGAKYAGLESFAVVSAFWLPLAIGSLTLSRRFKW